MLSFRVMKERYGWAVRMGDGVSSLFWTRAAAVREAHRLCEGLRIHGVAAEVRVEEVESAAAPRSAPLEVETV